MNQPTPINLEELRKACQIANSTLDDVKDRPWCHIVSFSLDTSLCITHAATAYLREQEKRKVWTAEEIKDLLFTVLLIEDCDLEEGQRLADAVNGGHV